MLARWTVMALRSSGVRSRLPSRPRVPLSGGERRPARKSWTTARAWTTAAVLRPGRLPRSYRCLSNRRLPLSTRRPRRALLLRGRASILAVASAAERHNSAGAGRPRRKPLRVNCPRINDMSVSR